MRPPFPAGVDARACENSDQVSAWSAVAATLNNVGPGLGDVAWTFREVPEAAKWVGALAMLVGRVEIFAIVLLVTPAFWER